MIHGAVVEVTCDRDHCHSSTYVDLEFTYGGPMQMVGSYNHNDRNVERNLPDEWIARDGKHYCSPECSHEPAAGIAATERHLLGDIE